MILCDVGNTSYHFIDGVNIFKRSVKTFNPLVIKEKVNFISVISDVKKKLLILNNWIELTEFITTKI